MRQNEKATVEQTLERWRNWLRRAYPGDRFTYHIGLLAEDRLEVLDIHGEERRTIPVEPFDSLAKEVLGACKEGYVNLYQRRLGPANYQYIAVRTGYLAPSRYISQRATVLKKGCF